MAERDIDKLLGGYATGTLTDEERHRLFEAALHDQKLFNALTREDALKEVLEDPKHRRRLLAALEAQQRATSRPLGALLAWFRRPANLALAGTLATVVLAVWIVVALQRDATLTSSEREEFARLLQTRQRSEPRPDPSIVKDALEHPALGVKVEAGGTASGKKSAETVPVAKERVAQGRSRADRAAGGAVSKAPASSQPAQPKARAHTDAPAHPSARSSQVLPKKETRSASPAAPHAASVQGGPQWLTAYRRPVEPGPARRLYYARPAPTPRRQTEELPLSRDEEGQRASEASPRAPAEEAFDLGSMAGLQARVSPKSLEPLGLRYSVLKQGGEGVFEETNPDGPFETGDALRVSVEVNETGYLYVFRLGPRGDWLWTSPSGPLGKHEGKSGVGVLSGQRYLIPGTGVLPLYSHPSATKMILIYSRRPRDELQVFHPALLGRRERDDNPPADLESLLSRARIDTSTQPLLLEQVHPNQPGRPQERAVYIVNPEAGQEAAIVIELTFPSG